MRDETRSMWPATTRRVPSSHIWELVHSHHGGSAPSILVFQGIRRTHTERSMLFDRNHAIYILSVPSSPVYSLHSTAFCSQNFPRHPPARLAKQKIYSSHTRLATHTSSLKIIMGIMRGTVYLCMDVCTLGTTYLIRHSHRRNRRRRHHRHFGMGNIGGMGDGGSGYSGDCGAGFSS